MSSPTQAKGQGKSRRYTPRSGDALGDLSQALTNVTKNSNSRARGLREEYISLCDKQYSFVHKGSSFRLCVDVSLVIIAVDSCDRQSFAWMAIQKGVTTEHPSVKTIHCTGTPYDIGLQHGSSAATEVHTNIATYTRFFQETAHISWEAARERAAAQFLPTLKARYPEILEEMKRIADGGGGGLLREDILILDVRSEISLTNYADGCTSISQVGKEGVFLAQNWDWLEELNRGMVLFAYQTTRVRYQPQIPW